MQNQMRAKSWDNNSISYAWIFARLLAQLRGKRFAGTQSNNLFGDHPFSIKHPQDNFGLQNVNWHPLYQKSPLDNLYLGGRKFVHFGG